MGGVGVDKGGDGSDVGKGSDGGGGSGEGSGAGSGVGEGGVSDDSSHEVEDERKDPRRVDRGKRLVAEMAGGLGGEGVGSETDLGQL